MDRRSLYDYASRRIMSSHLFARPCRLASVFLRLSVVMIGGVGALGLDGVCSQLVVPSEGRSVGNRYGPY